MLCKPFTALQIVTIAVTLMLNASAAISGNIVISKTYNAGPVSLDPQQKLTSSTLQLSHLVFDPLVRFDRELKLQPRLAQSWKQIDDVTLRIFLRKNVRFHSGNLFSAKDVKWSFDRIKKSKEFKGIFTPFKAAKIVDDHTIDFVTDGPYPLALQSLINLFPMDHDFYTGTTENGEDKAALTYDGTSFAASHVSGTGPFTIGYRDKGIKTEFQRNPNYWDTQSKGNVDKIVLTSIEADSTRIAALFSGYVDFAAPVLPKDMDRLRASRDVELITLQGMRIITLQLNRNRVKAFQDFRVRKAVDYAINNAHIVKRTMRGFATVAAQASPLGYAGHNPSLKPRFNIAKARALMADAGYKNGFSVTMMAPNNRYVNDAKIAKAVVSMLAKINIRVKLEVMPKAKYWPKFSERAADIMMIGWISDTMDSANFHQFLTACPNDETGQGHYNSGGYCNGKADALMLASQTELDQEKRNAMLQKLEKLLYDDAAFIPLHWQNLAWGARVGMNTHEIVNPLNLPYFGDLVVPTTEQTKE